MAPYWLNNSCSPFSRANASCTLGNLAQYAINVSSADDVIAGVHFARTHNIRLTIKNTGHDFLGRSAGAGSLALWTHHLKHIDIIPAYNNSASSGYNGPAIRIGAGVEYEDVYPLASAHGYRVVGGSCPTVGIAGGYTQGGGHGPLGGTYGLSADQVLAWEVVTAAGAHLTASPTENTDLYYALSGGGAGTYAVVLSVTVRAYPEGPVAGAGFAFANSGNDTAFWAGVTAWLQQLLVLDATVANLTTVWALTPTLFALEFATLPVDDTDTTNTTTTPTTAVLDDALAPFLAVLAALDVSLVQAYTSTVHASFAAHYAAWATQTYTSNLTVGGRLIPRATVADTDGRLPALVAVLRNITEAGGCELLGIAGHFAVGLRHNVSDNAVLPAWREALFTTSFAKFLAEDASVATLRAEQVALNAWQDQLRAVDGDGDGDGDVDGVRSGAYMNEATWDNAYWKEDYFGDNYERLLAIKEEMDPEGLFWANAAVGSDVTWKAAGEDGSGRLCQV